MISAPEKKIRICMVAPTFPIKGGISVFATSLSNYLLNEGHEVHFFSWKKQCPSFAVKDPYDWTLERTPYASFDLTWYNPLSWIWGAIKIARIKPDIFLHQWVNPLFALHFATMNCVVRLLSPKTKVVYSIHNVFPHENTLWTRFFQKIGFSTAHHFIVHAQTELEKIQQLGIQSATLITPPSTNIDKLDPAVREEMRKKLGYTPSDRVAMFFGYIRPYKGLDILIRAMKNVDAKLLVVGQFNESKEDYDRLISEEGVGSQLQIISQYVPEADVTKYFQACDLAVFPYRSATFSGPVMTAINHLKPVICTRVGCFLDIVDDGKTGYLVDTENPEALGNAINQYFNESPSWTDSIQKLNSRYSWKTYVDGMIDFTKKS